MTKYVFISYHQTEEDLLDPSKALMDYFIFFS